MKAICTSVDPVAMTSGSESEGIPSRCVTQLLYTQLYTDIDISSTGSSIGGEGGITRDGNGVPSDPTGEGETVSSRLAGRVLVVTGGASGIGRRTAELFAEEGAKVVIGDRNEQLLEEVRTSIGPARCATAVIDVTHEPDLERLVGLATDTFGQVDVAVNSAGIGTLGPIHDHPAESWQAVLDVCLTGVFFAVKHQARAMLHTGKGGVIINLASIYGRQPGEGMVAYCCAKAGVEMLTRVAALELGPNGIRVNAIAPGFVETPMTAPTQAKSRAAYLDSIPLGRVGQPDDIARAALFLASDDSAWFNGETLVVDGGEVHREAPRLLGRDR
jgi:3-oxoacyl-[acyl-carrier protein] reductase